MPRRPKPKPTKVRMKVADLMEVPPITVTTEATIDQAASVMWEKNVGSLLVVDGQGEMVGIVTEKDVVFAVSKLMTGRGVPVSSIVSRKIIKGTPTEGIATAIERMRKAKVRHLPILDKKGKPLGMLSMRDALEVSGPVLKVLLQSINRSG